MKTTGITTIHHRRLVVKANQPITIVFFGDVHRFAPGHCDGTWQRFKDKYRDRQDVYYVGMGDYLDLISAKERRVLDIANLHESTGETLHEFFQHKIEEFADEIMFMKSRLICMLEGNHHVRFADGTTTAQRICGLINRGLPDAVHTKYCGDFAIVRVSLTRKPTLQNGGRCFDMALHHGVGGGRTKGAAYNNLDHMSQSVEAHVYCMGDNHHRGIVTDSRLYLPYGANGQRLEHKTILKLRTGSFLRGYIEGKASYIADKMLNPTNLGVVEIEATYVHENKPPSGNDQEYIELAGAL